MSWHRVQHTLSTAYTNYSIHQVQHPPKISCLPCILMITCWPLNVASVTGMPPYKIDCHQLALHDRSKVKWLCHIPMAASQLTDEQSLSTQHTVRQMPPSTCPISHYHIFEVYLQTHLITASKYISPFSLDHVLEVYRQTCSITDFRVAWSWPPNKYLQTHSITASKCISNVSPPWPPSFVDHSLQVYLPIRLITASKCVSSFTRSWLRSLSVSLPDHHFQVHLELLSSTAYSQSRYTVCRWVAI